MAVQERPQLSLAEKTIDDPELEAALEEREQRKAVKKTATSEFSSADEEARKLLAKHDIADAPVRIGRFIVSESRREERDVSFTTSASKRLSIRPITD